MDLEEDDKDDPNAMDVDDAGDVEMAHSDGDGTTVPVTSSTDVAASSSGTIVPEVILFRIEKMTRYQRTWFYELVQSIMYMDYLFACNFTPGQNSLGDLSSIQYPFHWIILVYIQTLRNMFERGTSPCAKPLRGDALDVGIDICTCQLYAEDGPQQLTHGSNVGSYFPECNS